MAASRKPPVVTTGPAGWLRSNLFGSVFNSLVTVVVGAAAVWALFNLVTWTLGPASWEPVWNNLKLFAVYRYPSDLLWRPLLVVALLMFATGLLGSATTRPEGGILRGAFWHFAALVFLLTIVAFFASWAVRWLWLFASVAALAGFFLGRWLPRLSRIATWLWLLVLVLAVVLLYGLPIGGASSPLRVVPIRLWGGFMLTLVLTTGIIPSFPIGIALALGRRSQMPAIKYFCIAFIELIRGAPLITWLFIASLMVPLLFDVGPDAVPSLLKAYIAITAFSSAYMAENIRGGLQAVPRGQSEAARAVGLGAWQTMSLIVLPQAIRAVIPAIVGQAIGLFKDTALVFIVNLQDFFNVHNIVAQQPASLQVTGGIRLELALFLAVVYFYFAFRMSLASRQLERHLGVGER